MRRLVIVGCAGSGKSSLGRALGQALGLPVIERDTLGSLGSNGYVEALAAMAASAARTHTGSFRTGRAGRPS